MTAEDTEDAEKEEVLRKGHEMASPTGTALGTVTSLVGWTTA